MVYIIFRCYFQYIIIIHGRDLQNRMNVCFLCYNKPVSLGYRDRGEGTTTECVTGTCCLYLRIPKTMQLLHIGHIIGFPSSIFISLADNYLIVNLHLNC